MDAVFIGGCPRSGTTFLGQQLSRGAGVVVTPESQFTIDTYRMLAPRVSVDEARAAIAGHPRFRLWGLESRIVKSGDRRELVSREEAVSRAVTELVVQLYDADDGGEPAVWVDHTPWNVKFFYFLERLFPKARFVHIVRDPRGVAHSVLPLAWGPSTPVTAADFWSSHVLSGLALELDLGPSRAQRVRFEDVVRDPDGTVLSLLRWIGVGEMHAVEAFQLPAFYAENDHRLVGRAADTSRAEAWTHGLSRRAIEQIERSNGPAMEHFGYKLCCSDPPRARSAAERARNAVSTFLHDVGLNAVRERARIRRYAGRPRSGYTIEASDPSSRSPSW